ncbi:MAG TPA: hypothetical protein VK632_00705 [Verrucomicrobiae bacterium]|jgi:hypothetical protein|nr:hypothetical protein [Verrucomicrobiae bacterium]
MEKIDPQSDHEALRNYEPGCTVSFRGTTYQIERRTTLASGEAAVVLQNDKEQFEISASQFLAGVQSSSGLAKI